QRKRWPRLLILAINILFIPAISDNLERVFLGGRYIISWERIKMGIDSLKRTEYLKKTGIEVVF
ncbi:uncharacterized protein K441DRAFT_574706, partial [Cenococcum geophilum 1.58]|uniref:uncharacterized protein n=1 Tax=Cenococcum geophilum 1.58 TaxID=794803 RepID=UPI0035900BAF